MVFDELWLDVVLVYGDMMIMFVVSFVVFYCYLLVGYVEVGLCSGDIWLLWLEELNCCVMDVVLFWYFVLIG